MLMQKLREKTKLILWIVTIAFLGWILLDLGMDIVGRRIAKPYEQGFIAEVDGVRIPYDFYRDVFSRMIQDSSRLKGELTDFEEKRIEKEAWERVIEDIRFRKIAQDRNLFLDDSTVFFLLMNYPPPQIYNDTFFRKGDSFDIQKYREFMLNPTNYSFAVQYEKLIRETFPKELMRFDLMTVVHLTHTEIMENLKRALVEYEIEYLVFDPNFSPFKEEKIEEEKLLEYYNSHLEEFKQPPLVNLKMAIFWKRPSQQDTLSKIEEARTVKEIILGGTPFNEAAESYASSDTLKKSGGKLGWISIQEFPQKVRKVLDTLRGVSEPLIWRGRVYLFKVEKRKREKIFLKGIDFVIKTSETTKAEMRNKASDFVKLAEEIGFEKAADSLKVEIKETGFFPITLKFIPFLGENEEIWKFIQKAKVGAISNLIWNPNYFIVCKVKEKKEGGVKEFSEVKEVIRKKLQKEFRKKKLMEEARKARERWLREGAPGVSNKNYIFYKKVKDFKMGDNLPWIPNTYKIIGVIEKLGEGKISKPLEIGDKIVLVKMVKKKIPGDKEIKNKLQNYAQNLSAYRFNQIWNAWKKELRSPKDIKDYRSYLLY